MGVNPLAHNIMHLVIVLLAISLFCLSFLTYLRTRRGKFLLICGGFLVFALKEALVGGEVSGLLGAAPVILIHSLSLLTLLFFASGVLR